MTTPAYISVKDLADRWSCPKSTIYQQIRSRGIAALHIGQTIRIPLTEVERFERENTSGAIGNSTRKVPA